MKDFDELTEKEILMGIWMELQRMNASNSREDTSEPLYSCDKCEWEGTAEDRQRHAQEQHKAPPNMLDSLFTQVE